MGIPSSQSYAWNANVTRCGMRSFDYGQKYNDGNAQTVTVSKNVGKSLGETVSRKNSQPIIVRKLRTQPCVFLPELKQTNMCEDQRLNTIFRMCLESSFDGLGERVSLTSPKNFVVQYFTVPRNQPVKAGCESQYLSAEQGLRKQKNDPQRACPELTHCKHHRIISPQCLKPSNEIHDELAESTPCVILTKEADNSHKDDGRPSSCADELSKPRKETLQRTEPELSWQEKCSNFLINLTETLSDKFFGPRITCDESNSCKGTVVSDNPKLNPTQPVPQNFPRLDSTDQRNGKSVNSQTNTPENHGCHTSTSTKRVFLEKMKKSYPYHPKTFHSPHQKDVVLSKRSKLGTENCEKTANCIQSKESDPRAPRYKFRAKNSTNSLLFNRNERGKASPRFSNWPTILSEKIFGPRHEKVLQPCMVNDKVIDAKANKKDVESLETVNVAGSPLEEKKGRLLVKRYTIFQTPDAMEETLCFKILGKEQLPETRTRLQSEVCVMFTSDNQQKLDTAEKRNATKTCSSTGRSHTLKRCGKSKANYNRSGSRQVRQLEEKTSTEHIFLPNIIMKLFNSRKINIRDTTNGKKCYQEKTIRRSTISRRYATTSIHKYGHKPIKCSGNVARKGQENGAVPCCLEQKISSDCCTDPEFPNVAGEDEIRGEIASAENYHNICNTHGSSKTTDFVKSGVSSVIDDSCRKEASVFHTSHGDKCDAKCTVRGKYCEEIQSPNKSAFRVRKRNRIQKYDSRSECQGCFDRNLSAQRKGTTETEICVLKHRDKSVAKKEFKDCEAVGESEILTPRNYNLILSQRGKERRKKFSIEQSPVGEVCEKLIIKEDGIFYTAKDRGLQYFGKSPRPTVVVAGENIHVKMFYDRETLTDDMPELSQGTTRAQCTHAKDEEKMQSLSPPSHKPGRMGIAEVPQSAFPVESLSSSVQRVHPEQIGNGSMQKQQENCVEMRLVSEECVGLLREDNTSRASPGGIPKPGMGKVFSPLCQKASEKCKSKVFGGEACAGRASIDSESEEAPAQSHLKDDNFPSSSVVATTSTAERRSESWEEGAVDYGQSLNDYSEKCEPLDGVEPSIDSPETKRTWKRSSRKDLSVAKPESRNIINSYYSQRENGARCEVRNDEYSKVKKEKERRDGSGAHKSIAKACKSRQPIENVRQVDRTAKIGNKNGTGKKESVVKENDVTNEKASATSNGGFLDNVAKVHLVQNIAMDASTLLNGFNADSHTSPEQELKNRRSRASRSTASKIPRKSGPLSKSKSPIRVLYSAAKAPESQNAKIEERFRRNWSEIGNSKTACSEADAKETNGKPGKIADSESSNGVTSSIDSSKAKGSETQRELQAPAVYVIDTENVKVKTSQIEMRNAGMQNTQKDSIVKGTSGSATRRGNSKSSKSPRRQRAGEDGTSPTAGGERERKENIQAMKNQSKSETSSERKEIDKKSTALEILSQNDSAEIDADGSTQGRLTRNVDLFNAALMDGANNVQSYSDSLSAAEENHNAHRNPATKGERLHESRIATVRGKPKLSRPSKGQRTGNASVKMNNAKKSVKSEDGSSKTTESSNTADTATGKEDTQTSLANAHYRNSGKALKADAEYNKVGGTREFLSVSVSSRNSLTRQFSVRTNKRLSCEFEASTDHMIGGTSMSSSRANSDLDEKRHQGSVCRDAIVPGRRQPSIKSCGHKDALKSSCVSGSTKNAKNFKQQSHDCREEEENKHYDPTEVICDISDHQVREIYCKKSVDPRCEGTVSRVLCKSVSGSEKGLVLSKYDDMPEKLRTFRDNGKSNTGPTRENSSSTDDLKRILDQDFVTLRKGSDYTDCQKLNHKERDSNSSIPSIQKAYSALKTILNKSKNIRKGSMHTKQTKGTQIHPRTQGKSRVCVEDYVKSHRTEIYPGSKISHDNQSPILSMSFENSISSNSSSPAREEKKNQR